MKGAEHYREAERLNKAAADQVSNVGQALNDGNLHSAAVAAAMTMVATLIARAQVHATLALAAATAYPAAKDWHGDEDRGESREWAGATS